jgi:hypothetical protein
MRGKCTGEMTVSHVFSSFINFRCQEQLQQLRPRFASDTSAALQCCWSAGTTNVCLYVRADHTIEPQKLSLLTLVGKRLHQRVCLEHRFFLCLLLPLIKLSGSRCCNPLCNYPPCAKPANLCCHATAKLCNLCAFFTNEFNSSTNACLVTCQQVRPLPQSELQWFYQPYTFHRVLADLFKNTCPALGCPTGGAAAIPIF